MAEPFSDEEMKKLVADDPHHDMCEDSNNCDWCRLVARITADRQQIEILKTDLYIINRALEIHLTTVELRKQFVLSQQALREIIEGRHTKNCSLAYGNDPSCECYLELAKNAIKEE